MKDMDVATVVQRLRQVNATPLSAIGDFCGLFVSLPSAQQAVTQVLEDLRVTMPGFSAYWLEQMVCNKKQETKERKIKESEREKQRERNK